MKKIMQSRTAGMSVGILIVKSSLSHNNYIYVTNKGRALSLLHGILKIYRVHLH